MSASLEGSALQSKFENSK